MTDYVLDVRVISSTIKDGRVGFNQVVLVQNEPPAGVAMRKDDSERPPGRYRDGRLAECRPETPFWTFGRPSLPNPDPDARVDIS